MTEDSTKILFLYGKGGAGKDTLANKIIEATNGEWISISTGDIIKEALFDPTHPHHSKVEPFLELVEQGINLPDEVVINPDFPREGIFSDILETEIAIDTAGIISTGFPRKIGQHRMSQKYIKQLKEEKNIEVLHLYIDVDDEVSRDRIETRRIERIAEGLEPRNDDTPAAIPKRLETFRRDTVPVLEELRKEGILHEIDGNGTPEQVYELAIAELRLRPPGIEHEPHGKERF